MPAKTDDKKQLRCSFCGKPQDQVKKLIAGKDVYICDECVKLCSDIIYEDYNSIMRKAKRFLCRNRLKSRKFLTIM